jgi:hypothetical protein
MVLAFRTIQAWLIWSTAVATLIAGVPHLECLCPNGRQKPFCLSIVSSRTGCYCGGSCCASAAAEKPCCRSGRQPSADSNILGIQVSRDCCQKTLAQDQIVGVTPTTKRAQQSADCRLQIADLPGTLQPLIGKRQPRLCLSLRQEFDLSPPEDLVIALQHFLI